VRSREVVTRWLAASPATRVGGPVAALLLGVSRLFGGLDHVPLADRAGDVKPGAEVTVQPFALTLLRAVVVDGISYEFPRRTHRDSVSSAPASSSR
jgi:hypothetical protein